MDRVDDLNSSEEKQTNEESKRDDCSKGVEVSVWIWITFTLEALHRRFLVHIHVVVAGVIALTLDSFVSAFQPDLLALLCGKWLLSKAGTCHDSLFSLLLCSLSPFALRQPIPRILLHVAVGAPDLDSVVELNLLEVMIELILFSDVLSEAIINLVIYFVIDRDCFIFYHLKQGCFLGISGYKLVVHIILLLLCISE
jgi:hypothetical protein